MAFKKTSIVAGMGMLLAGLTNVANAVPTNWADYAGSSFFDAYVPPKGKSTNSYDVNDGIDALTKLLSQFSSGDQNWPFIGDFPPKGPKFPPYGNPSTSVPEPATLALMGIGLLGTAAAARRRKKLQS